LETALQKIYSRIRFPERFDNFHRNLDEPLADNCCISMKLKN